VKRGSFSSSGGSVLAVVFQKEVIGLDVAVNGLDLGLIIFLDHDDKI